MAAAAICTPYDAENRLLTVTKTPDALSAACDTNLTLTTGGSGTWSAQTAEAGVYRFEAKRHVYEGSASCEIPTPMPFGPKR